MRTFNLVAGLWWLVSSPVWVPVAIFMVGCIIALKGIRWAHGYND